MKRKFNWFDIVIVVVVLIAAVVGYKFTHKEVAIETQTLRYTVELTENPVGFTDLIEIGDEFTDNVKNYYMGKVVAVEKETYKKSTPDKENGIYLESEVKELETAIVTLEAPVTDDGANFKVNGYYTVKTGLAVAIKGYGYAGRGYVINVERGEN